MKNIYRENYINTKCSHYSRTMLGNTKIMVFFVSLLSIAAGIFASVTVASGQASASISASASVPFQVNVVGSLTVSVTTPADWASGGINTFLRNTVGLEVSSNEGNGFTASMYSKYNTTNLTNATSGNSETLPTLASSSARSSFPANYWGYSLGEYVLDGATQTSYTLNGNSYGETAAGNESSNYYPLVSTSNSPITVMNGTNKRSGSQNIYFGAKANATKASGTYTGTVVISVVTGTVDPSTNPITPTNPATPQNTSPSSPTSYAYDSTNDRTIYSHTTTNAVAGTETTTTQVSSGDTTSAYSSPQGVVQNSHSNISSATPLATGLAVTAAVAATSGYMFFIVANRREREDEEEEES